MGDEDAVGVRPVRSHVSLPRLTVDTGVSPENLENRFGEFKIEANSLYETPVPGTTLTGKQKKKGALLRPYRRRTTLKLSQYELVLLQYDPVLIRENPKRASDQREGWVVPFELVLLSR